MGRELVSFVFIYIFLGILVSNPSYSDELNFQFRDRDPTVDQKSPFDEPDTDPPAEQPSRNTSSRRVPTIRQKQIRDITPRSMPSVSTVGKVDTSPEATPDNSNSGFITEEDVVPYRGYKNFNPSCPAVIPVMIKENEMIPSSFVFDWFVDWWTQSEASNAVTSCSVPQEGFISDCRDKDSKSFYRSLMSRSGFGTMPLIQFFEDYLSNRKETYLVGFNHALPTLASVPSCLSKSIDGTLKDSTLLLAFSEYISNLTRLKRGALLTIEQLTNIDRMLSVNTEFGSPVLNGINCGNPETISSKISNEKETGGPTSFVEEKLWCDKLATCDVPKDESTKQLLKIIQNTQQFYKDLKFLYIQKSVYSAARTMLMNRSEFLQRSGVDNCSSSFDGLAGFGITEGRKSIYYPYNYFAEFVYKAYNQDPLNKKDLADKLNFIWEEFEPEIIEGERDYRIDGLTMVYFKPSIAPGIGYRVLNRDWTPFDNEKHVITVFKETFIKPQMNECIDKFVIEPSSTDKDSKIFKIVQKIVSELEVKIIKLKLNAQANMPWVFSPEFIDLETYSEKFIRYLFSQNPSELEVRAMFINKFKSDRIRLISALSDYRRAARCMTSSGYAESTCEDLNDIIERIPYFNPLSLTKENLKGSKCFIGAYGYAQGYLGSVECARQVKKYNKQYDQIAWDSTKAIGFTIATAGLSGLAMAGRLTQAALAGSRAAHLTRLGAGLAALGLDGYLGGEGVSHAYKACKDPIEAYGVATRNIDLAEFSSGPKCTLAEDRVGNNVNDLKQQAGSCVGAAVMSLAFDLLPIIPSIGALGAIKRANVSRLDDVARTADIKKAPDRQLAEAVDQNPKPRGDGSDAPTRPKDAPDAPKPRVDVDEAAIAKNIKLFDQHLTSPGMRNIPQPQKDAIRTIFEASSPAEQKRLLQILHEEGWDSLRKACH